MHEISGTGSFEPNMNTRSILSVSGEWWITNVLCRLFSCIWCVNSESSTQRYSSHLSQENRKLTQNSVNMNFGKKYRWKRNANRFRKLQIHNQTKNLDEDCRKYHGLIRPYFSKEFKQNLYGFSLRIENGRLCTGKPYRLRSHSICIRRLHLILAYQNYSIGMY